MKLKQQKNVTALYCRYSKDEDYHSGNSMSIRNQVLICKGGILPPNTYYDCDDCGSFVVNRKAVIGKEKEIHITAENSAKNGVVAIIKFEACAFDYIG